MKKKYILLLAFCIVITLFGVIYKDKIVKKDVTYLEAIDEVFSRSINGMSVIIVKVPTLNAKNGDILRSTAANKENNFSADSEDGVLLWEAKQLFLNIKDLEAIREVMSQQLEKESKGYYIVQTAQDYDGDRKIGLHHLTLFIDADNYHIYVPQNYDESNPISIEPTLYIEYKSNEITKKLINDIIKQN